MRSYLRSKNLTVSSTCGIILTVRYVNLTPHAIVLNDGREFPSSGTVARVSSTHTAFDELGICSVAFGDITGLPSEENGTIYIVSGMVAQATFRTDLVSPATGHPLAKRNDKGQIVSVPGFVR